MNLSLALLQEKYVFEATPVKTDLAALHVPFDDLTSTTNTEQRLDVAVRRSERVALIGASGSGKSSVVAHVLGPLAEGVAPMLVPVAAMPSDTVDRPSNLVDHLLDTVARNAKAANLSVDVDAARATRSKITKSVRKASLGGSYRFLKGEIGKEVTRQTKVEMHATFADKTDALVQVFQTIHDSGLRPILVFDDTDRWLRNGGVDLAASFFGETVRWMLDLPAGLVVAVHPSYFEMSSRPDVLEYLDTQIDIPVLDSPTSIEAILTRRIEQYAEITAPDLGDVLDADVSAVLLELYGEFGSLRRALQVCHIALHEAVGAGANRISSGHIVAAANAG